MARFSNFSLPPNGLRLLRDLQVELEVEVEVERILRMNDEELLIYVVFERDVCLASAFKSSKAIIDEAMAQVVWYRPEYPKMTDD